MKKNIKKAISLILILVMCATSLLVVTGCGNGSDTASSDEVITLVYASADSSTDNKNAVVAEAWMNRVEELSEGRIEFQRVYDGQAATFADMVESVKSGIVDIGAMMSSSYGDAYPLNELFCLPLLNEHPDYVANAKAFEEMLEKYPDIAAEYEAQGIMFLNTCPAAGQAFAFSEKTGEVTDVEGLKGKIITCFNSIDANWLGKLGAVADMSAPTDIYDSMTKGVIDGTLISFTGGTALNVVEATEYVMTTPNMNGIGRFNQIMNIDSYNKIPDDLKYLFEPEFQNYIGELYAYQFMQDELSYKQMWIDRGIEFYEMTEAEMEAFMPATEEIYDEWIAKVDALGYDGQKMMDEYVSLVAKYMDEIDLSETDYAKNLETWLGQSLPETWSN